MSEDNQPEFNPASSATGRQVHSIVMAISAVADAIEKQNRFDKHFDALQKGQRDIVKQIALLETKIMSAVSEAVAKFNEQFKSIGDDVDIIVASQEGIAKDVAFLKDTISKLEGSPEDKELLAAAIETVTGLATKTKAASTAIKALDDATDSSQAPA